METFEKTGSIPVGPSMPPLAGTLRWIYAVRQRITIPVTSFKQLENP